MKRELYQRLLSDPALAARVALLAEPSPVGEVFTSPERLSKEFFRLLAGRPVEAIAVVAFNAKLRVVGSTVSTIGSQSNALVDFPGILRWALTVGKAPARFFAIGHNHPSGDPEFSSEDRRFTIHLEEAGRAIGIRLVDSIVVVDSGAYSSAAEDGLLSGVSFSDKFII
jgi:DNA repair protein RadC